MALAMAEIAIQIGMELAVKAIVNRYIRTGMSNDQLLKNVMKRVQILEKAHLVSDRDILVLHAKIDDVITEVQKTLTRQNHNMMLVSHFLGMSEALWPWANVLLVLYNATRLRKFENAKLLLYELDEEDDEELIIAGMTFTKNDINDTETYMRNIAAFAKKASRTDQFRCELEISPNEDPNGRNSKLCSVVFELVVTAFEHEKTRNMAYILGDEMIVPKPGCGRSMCILINENEGFVQDMDEIQAKFSVAGDADAAYDGAEKEYRDKLKEIEATNDVYFLGLTGEGKSSLINALMGERATRTRDIGVGTTRIEQYTLVHRQKMLRLWDLPGGDDENNMDEYNIEKLRCHLRSEQQVASVILVNQKGRNLRQSEQRCLLLYKDIFGSELHNIITVVVGRDEADCIDGVPVNTRRMRRHMVGQLENLGIDIKPEQIVFLRPVAVGTEVAPPPSSGQKIVALKDHLASKRPVFTGFAYWMYTKLLEITNMRTGTEKSRLFEELRRENETYVRDFIDGVNVNRRAKLVRKHDGLVLSYSDFDARAWIKRKEVLFRIDITGDDYGIVTRLHNSFGKRKLGAVRIKAQLSRIFKDLREIEETENQLVLIRTNEKTLPKERGCVIWKEYRLVDPLKGISDYTKRRVREIIDELMANSTVKPSRSSSFDSEDQRCEPIYG